MLGKLLKYEFKSISRLMIPLFIGIFAASLLGAGAISLEVFLTKAIENNAFVGFMMAGLMMVIGLLFLAILAASFVSMFIIMQRFYKSCYSDEGYLTFTLPVTTNQILLSKTISGFIWTIINAVVIIISVIVSGFIIYFATGGNLTDAWAGIQDIFEFFISAVGLNVDAIEVIFILLEYLILIIVAALYSILLVYLSITIGCQVARKHKILASLGFFFIITMGISMVNSVIQFIIMIPLGFGMQSSTYSFTNYYHITNWSNIILSAAIAIGSYFICRHIMNKKLNLE